MEWQKKFEVGNHKIDLEHQVFFELITNLDQAHENDVSREKQRRILAEIQKYAEFHFLSEENMMIDVDYPEFEEHHEHHQVLLDELRNYVVQFEAGEPNVPLLVEFMVQWFMGHTTREDLKLSTYLIGGEP